MTEELKFQLGTVEAMLVSKETMVLVAIPPKKVFVCPKGHRYETTEAFIFGCFIGSAQPYLSGPLCPYCYVDWHKENFPTTEVKEG